MAKKIKNKKNWYKGISATAITLALAGAALSVPAFAGDVTDTDTTENIPTTGTSSNEKISENVLTETVLSSENVDVDWETPEPSEENNSMVSEGTVTEDELVIGDVTKEETTVETVQPPVYDTEHAESETTQTVNPDGSITETTTTTTPGSQTTETTVSGTITGEIETTPELTEDETAEIEGEITSDVETSISNGTFDWQGMASGSTTTIDDYTVTKNQDGSFTFSKSDPSDPQEGSLSDDDIDKLFGKGYSRDENGNLVDEDGHVITIFGNTVTVTSETKVDVEITENTGSKSIDADLVFSGDDANSEVAKIFDKLTPNGDGYKFDGQNATVTKDDDGNITKIVVGNTTYDFGYDKTDISVTDPYEIVKLLGKGYSYTNGKYYKGTSEITLDNINETLKAQSVTVNVTTTTQNETIVDSGSSTEDFDYEINDNQEYTSLDEAYKGIISQITGNQYTGGELPQTDKYGNAVSLTYDDKNQTVTITTTILASKLTNDKIAGLLGNRYTVNDVDHNLYDSNGNLVEVTFDENETVTLTTKVKVISQTKNEYVQVPGEVTTGGSHGDVGNFDWAERSLDFYVRLDGQIVDYNDGASRDTSEYTTSVSVNSKLGYKKDVNNPYPTDDKATWIYQGTVDKPDANGFIDTSAGEVINSYFDLDIDNNIDGKNDSTKNKDFVIQNAPSDTEVFEKIFNTDINKNNDIKYYYHNENGEIKSETLTKDYYNENKEDFSIYWYVLKYDDSDGYHIDGCVVYNPSPAIGVTIKNWYETRTESEWDSPLTATVKVTEKDTATGKYYNSGIINYTIPDSPIITFESPVVTKKTNLNLTYQYKINRT